MGFSQCRPFDIYQKRNEQSKNLNRSICVPSAIQSYSICIEYLKYWLLKNFPKDFFKSIYIDEKNIYDEQRTLSKIDIIKRQKPALAIKPNINWEFNDENVDLHQFGLNVYSPRGLYKQSFFNDNINNVHMGLCMRKLLVEFGVQMRFETKPQQMDMYEYMRLALKVGSTNGEDVDLDFHIPYSLMLQIAHDTGFEICYEEGKQDRIVNVRGFLGYLNSHSPIPFLYKFRTINGKHEFFIRMQGMYVHIKSTSLSADNGEREGHMMNNFTIEWTCEVRFPAPQLYAYYSEAKHELDTVYSAWYQPDGAVSSFYIFKGTEIPETNRYGWIKYLSTSYEEDNEEALYKPLKIDITELLEGDLNEVIQDCICNMISPSIFIEFLLINDGREMAVTVDWDRMILKTKDNITNLGSYLVFYVDMEYINNALITKREMDKNRISFQTKDPKHINRYQHNIGNI